MKSLSTVGTGDSVGLTLLICGFVGLTACQAAAPDKPAVETELDNAKLLEADLSPENLARRTRTDLQWQDGDGARFYFWVTEQSAPRRYSFTMDRAYRLRHEGQVLWAFLDATAREHSPAAESLKLRHVRTTFEYPAKNHPDANHTYAELLAARGDGAAVFKIVYASRGGDRPHQEDMRTCLIYRNATGGWQLAGHDLGHEGNTPASSTGCLMTTEMKVVWGAKPESRPFTVQLRQRSCHYGRGETADKSYEAYRDGVMDGPLPMRLRMEPGQYVIANGADSLRATGQRLAFFHSDWWDVPWVSDPQAAKLGIENEWTTILEQANPGFSAGAVPEEGRHILIPDNEYAIARSIFERLSPRFQKPTTRDAESGPRLSHTH